MQKFIIALCIFGLLGFATSQNAGTYMRVDYLTKSSGIKEAFDSVGTLKLEDQEDSDTLRGKVEFFNGVAKLSKIDLSKLSASFNETTHSLSYSGFNVEGTLNFEYTDSFLPLQRKFEGTGSGAFNVSSVYISVTYGINPSTQGPSFQVSVSLAFSDPTFSLTDFNDTVIDDVKLLVVGPVKTDLSEQIRKAIENSLNTVYQNKSTSYQTLYNYTFNNLTATVNNSILQLESTTGLVYKVDGNIVGYSANTSTIPAFNSSLASAQVVFTKQFLTNMFTYPMSKDYFTWTFPNPNLRLPDFDFAIADIYFIFPESVKDYTSPADTLSIKCNADKTFDPNIKFDEEYQRVEISQRLHCTMTHPASSKDLMEFAFDVKYLIDFEISEKGEASVQIFSSLPIGTVNIIKSQYTAGTREKSIIDSIIREAVEIYDASSVVWGNGFQTIPMAGEYFLIKDNNIVFFGSAPSTNDNEVQTTSS